VPKTACSFKTFNLLTLILSCSCNSNQKWKKQETRRVKSRGGVRQGCCLSPILINLYSKYLTKEALDGFEDLKVEGPVICIVKYANYLVSLAKVEAMVWGIITRLNEIGRCYGMEINVGKKN
jgi:hypothetical protein